MPFHLKKMSSDSYTCVFLMPQGNPDFHGVWGFFPFFSLMLPYVCHPQLSNHILLPSQPQISTYFHLILLFSWYHSPFSHLFLTFSPGFSIITHQSFTWFLHNQWVPASILWLHPHAVRGQLPQRPFPSNYYFYVQLCTQITSTAFSIPLWL